MVNVARTIRVRLVFRQIFDLELPVGRYPVLAIEPPLPIHVLVVRSNVSPLSSEYDVGTRSIRDIVPAWDKYLCIDPKRQITFKIFLMAIRQACNRVHSTI